MAYIHTQATPAPGYLTWTLTGALTGTRNKEALVLYLTELTLTQQIKRCLGAVASALCDCAYLEVPFCDRPFRHFLSARHLGKALSHSVCVIHSHTHTHTASSGRDRALEVRSSFPSQQLWIILCLHERVCVCVCVCVYRERRVPININTICVSQVPFETCAKPDRLKGSSPYLLTPAVLASHFSRTHQLTVDIVPSDRWVAQSPHGSERANVSIGCRITVSSSRTSEGKLV